MTADAAIRILVVDDHPLLREGIAAVLQGQADMQLVGEAANGIDAIAQFRALRPDVTLMDLQMPGMGGIEAIAALRREFPDARIAVLTTYRGDAQALRAIKAGAAGYLLKSMLRRELADTVRSLHAGRRVIPADIAMAMAEHVTDETLSLREIDVLRLAGGGNSNREIGQALGIAEDTVKAHMKNVLAKLHARDRTHAVTIALRRGILDA
ncbi:DNA-binding NarL/FixJ family response regulator [Chiayiivirga flava]|uniref:DNA-binding NarL/FixJ family response regulator n=1 Tax=Chiayiivirga flava TaxID=659595 RepID=A0A7W8D9J0_9GAMM|nr:DNA-binding NarL/FixJ family response regulator [Chiayiivirga flava]